MGDIILFVLYMTPAEFVFVFCVMGFLCMILSYLSKTLSVKDSSMSWQGVIASIWLKMACVALLGLEFFFFLGSIFYKNFALVLFGVFFLGTCYSYNKLSLSRKQSKVFLYITLGLFLAAKYAVLLR